ncbi:MAG: cytidylate kinase family protein, partial [Verrucomicrobia bacterium]|nr:cytidylate kinase family protein [Verrucomicrobiota bacterium]
TRPVARARILQEDRGRKRYLRKYFDADPDDPLLYHLIINTDDVPYEEAARIIGEAVLRRR